jgi:hypothetical protein
MLPFRDLMFSMELIDSYDKEQILTRKRDVMKVNWPNRLVAIEHSDKSSGPLNCETNRMKEALLLRADASIDVGINTISSNDTIWQVQTVSHLYQRKLEEWITFRLKANLLCTGQTSTQPIFNLEILHQKQQLMCELASNGPFSHCIRNVMERDVSFQ